jgi:hypothetical protein
MENTNVNISAKQNVNFHEIKNDLMKSTQN